MGHKPVDAFTQHVMANIDQEVFKSLNIVQLEAIRQSISAGAPFKKHPVDIRFVLPLYFFSLYVVFLIGRDKRGHIRQTELKRRTAMKGMSLVMALYLLIAASLPIIFIMLYLLKSALGIDIFPDSHLRDWF